MEKIYKVRKIRGVYCLTLSKQMANAVGISRYISLSVLADGKSLSVKKARKGDKGTIRSADNETNAFLIRIPPVMAEILGAWKTDTVKCVLGDKEVIYKF